MIRQKNFKIFSQPSMLKRAKTAHVVSEARQPLPDLVWPLVFPYLDLKDHSRFARSCNYALTQSGLTEESPRRGVWAKHMHFNVFTAHGVDRFRKFTSICKPSVLHLSLYHAWFDVCDVACLAKMPLKSLVLKSPCQLNVSADVLTARLDKWSFFTQLEVLDASRSPITSLAFVRKLLKLKVLSIDSCDGLSNDSFRDLVHLPDLCDVNFDNIHHLTKDSVKHLGCLALTKVKFCQIEMNDEWVENLLLSPGPRPVVEKVEIYEAHLTTRSLSCLQLLPSLRELKMRDSTVDDLSPLLLLRLKSLHLKFMYSVDWSTLHGLVCGNVFIDHCTFASHVTVELRTTDGDDVVVHAEVGEPDNPDFGMIRFKGDYVQRTVRSSQMLH